jgi:energy-coupling factor transport system ATP-binding protein
MGIKVENLNYIYAPGTAMEHHTLKDVNFEIKDHEFVGIIGRTGSGKSTLIQHLNGLLKATSGKIYVDGEDIYAEGYNMRALRQKVGLVFQYPEYQLFETDVITDVKFGPKNQGLSDEECIRRAKEALALAGVDESLWERSPFDLSGGQKRRVAIAGIVAMKPEVLVLDEPTAGLDPQGRDSIFGSLEKLHHETGMSIVMVSHSMEDVAKYVSRLLVIKDGTIAYDDTPREVFKHYRELEKIGLSAPQITYLVQKLRERGWEIPDDIITVADAYDAIKNAPQAKGLH